MKIRGANNHQEAQPQAQNSISNVRMLYNKLSGAKSLWVRKTS